MTMSMFKPASFAALAILILAHPSATMAQQGGTSMDGAERLTDLTWLAEDIKGAATIDAARSTVAIAADGKVSGSGGCNLMFGRAKINGPSLTFEPLATTRKACAPAVMDQERKFLAALATTRTYRLDGTLLRFYDESGAELVRFKQLR
jgi:heat shock protein HslJ